MRFNIEEISKRIEATWKHIAYNPKNDSLYLLSDPYKCMDTNDTWFDYQDGKPEKKVRINAKRIRQSKTKDWIYVCEK